MHAYSILLCVFFPMFQRVLETLNMMHVCCFTDSQQQYIDRCAPDFRAILSCDGSTNKSFFYGRRLPCKDVLAPSPSIKAGIMLFHYLKKSFFYAESTLFIFKYLSF
jgi:hypothetical protein